MKKLLTITLALCAVIVAMACGSNDPDVDGVTGATEQNGEGGEGTAKGKMLLVYFSRAGENWQASQMPPCLNHSALQESASVMLLLSRPLRTG